MFHIRDTLLAAARGLLRAPAATVLTVICIALGVAASATALSLAWTVTIRPLPFPDADRLARVWLASDTDPRLDLSIPDLADVAAAVPAFDVFAGTARTRFVALLEDGAARLRGEAVTADYFGLLGVSAARGRLFGSADHGPGAPPVALISAAAWRRYFGSDPAVVGQPLRTENATFEIVGVLEPGFDGSVESDVVEFWIPLDQYLPATAAQLRLARQSWAIGRLAPGASLAVAREQLRSLATRLGEEHGAVYRGLTLRAEPLGENWRSGVRDSGLLLLAAALVLLVIAVVNVSGMSLARALDRRREFALRAALGAGTGQVALLPFVEGALAAAAGGVLGAAASPWLLQSFLEIAPIALPGYLEPSLNGPVVLVVVTLTALAAMGAGALPAVEARRSALGATLREGARGQMGARTDGRLSRGLVAAQVALTTALVVVAALLGRSYQAMNDVSLGFRTDVARFAVTASAADRAGDGALFRARLAESLRGAPGVAAVGLAWPTLPPWDPFRPAFSHAALGDLDPDRAPRLGGHAVDRDLFAALGMTIRAGRGIEAQDDTTRAPVVVISEALAERLGGAASVLGTELIIVDDRPPVPARARIVGVAADVAWDGLGEHGTGRLIRWRDPGDPRAPRYDAYWSIDQVPAAAGQVSLAARVAGDPAAAVEPLTRVLGNASPLSAVHWAGAMSEEIAVEYRTASFALFLSLSFGATALFLAGIGIFAILTHTVARRVPEFALRLALGATPRLVRISVLRSGLTVVLIGCSLGALAAGAATRGLRQVLYEVAPVDPVAFGSAIVTLFLVAVAACWLPARRAAGVNPMETLSRE